MMKVLQQGIEPVERVNILISFTSIESIDVKQALIDHLSRGLSASASSAVNAVKPSNFSRALSILEEVAKKVEQIKEIDYKHIT